MKFKDFLANEEQSGTDKGLMGFPVPAGNHKPSDGQPFKDKLSSVSGMMPKGNSGGAMGAQPMGGQPMFMKKKMKKL